MLENTESCIWIDTCLRIQKVVSGLIHTWKYKGLYQDWYMNTERVVSGLIHTWEYRKVAGLILT